MRTLLTEREAAKLLGVSERHFRRIASRFESVESEGRSPNGKPSRLYRIGSFPDDAQQRWAMQQGWQVVAGAPDAPAKLLNETEAAGLLSPGAGSGLLLAPVDVEGVEHGFRVRGEAEVRGARCEVRGGTGDALPHGRASDGTQIALNLAAPSLPAISAEDRAVADARYAIIEPLIAPERHRALWAQFHGRVELIQFLARQHETKVRTIYNWINRWKAEKHGGLLGLVNRDRADKGQSRLANAGAVKNFILRAALPKFDDPDPTRINSCQSNMTVREMYRAYDEERAWRSLYAAMPMPGSQRAEYERYIDDAGRLLPQAQLPPLSYETFRGWHARIPAIIRDFARLGPEHYFNVHALITSRDYESLKPLEWVVMDHRMLDIMCLVRDPRGGRHGWRLIRPWLTAAIDMRTRKWLAWVLVETPSSDSIAACLKRLFLDHGIPEWFYWDNGKDFCCEWLEGGDVARGEKYRVSEINAAMRGVCDRLGVRIHHALPRRPHSKIIEPNFKTTALFDRTLPWWCGNKPAARPEGFRDLIAQHKLWLDGGREQPAFPTAEYVAWLYDAEMEHLNTLPHTGGEGMRRVTPEGYGWMSAAECWDSLIPAVTVRRADPADLQFAFAKSRQLTVRQGEIQPTFGGRRYHYRFRGDRASLMLYNEREVTFGFDPLDLGTGALYCDGRFLGLVDCVELSRMGEDAFVEDERDRRAAAKAIRGLIAAAHQAVPMAGAEQRARRRREVSGSRVAGHESPQPAAIVLAELPPAIREAARAHADRAFSFNAETGAALAVEQPPADGDDEFSFFER